MVILDDDYLDFVIRVQKYFHKFDDAARILKVCEESGEAAEAYLRLTQANPRKAGVPVQEVVGELADVALTALVAIAHFGFDPNRALEDQRQKTEGRMRDNPS